MTGTVSVRFKPVPNSQKQCANAINKLTYILLPKKSVGWNSHGSAGNSHSHCGGFPFPPIPNSNSVFYSHFHGNPIPTRISTLQQLTWVVGKMRNCGIRKVKCGMTLIGRTVKPRDHCHSAYYRISAMTSQTSKAVKCGIAKMRKMQTMKQDCTGSICQPLFNSSVSIIALRATRSIA